MNNKLQRNITLPIREYQGWEHRWLGPDEGLIWCWERGRQKRNEEPELAARAENGELVELPWHGGVTKKLKDPNPIIGSFKYLATWQGLRGENLDIDLDQERVIVCTRTGQAVRYRATRLKSDLIDLHLHASQKCC